MIRSLVVIQQRQNEVTRLLLHASYAYEYIKYLINVFLVPEKVLVLYFAALATST